MTNGDNVKATIVGFTIETNTPVTLADLWSHLAKQPKEHEYRKARRVLYLAIEDGHAIGLMLTTKSHKKACELVSEGGKLNISITKSAANAERVDFNFIIIRLSSNRGLYLQYRGSWSMNAFGDFLQKQFSELVATQKEKAFKASGATVASKKGKQVRDLYKRPNLDLTLMVRKEKFRTLLQQMKKIRSFEFPLMKLTMDDNIFTPLSGSVKSERHKITFLGEAGKSGIVQGILNVINSAGIETGTVHGRDAGDLETHIDIVNNPDVYHFFNFDDIADEQNLDLDDFKSSKLLQTMRGLLDANEEVFGKHSPDESEEE